MWQHLVLRLDLAGGGARGFFAGGGNGGDFLALPLEFATGLSNDQDALDAGGFFGGGGIDGSEAGMGMRAGEVEGIEHVLQLEV